jgi:hypothetical protein
MQTSDTVWHVRTGLKRDEGTDGKPNEIDLPPGGLFGNFGGQQLVIRLTSEGRIKGKPIKTKHRQAMVFRVQVEDLAFFRRAGSAVEIDGKLAVAGAELFDFQRGFRFLCVAFDMRQSQWLGGYLNRLRCCLYLKSAIR